MFILMGGSAENGHNPIKLVPVGLMVFKFKFQIQI